MTRLYPSTNGTPPNTWRDNAAIWSATPTAALLVVITLFLMAVESGMPRRLQ